MYIYKLIFVITNLFGRKKNIKHSKTQIINTHKNK